MSKKDDGSTPVQDADIEKMAQLFSTISLISTKYGERSQDKLSRPKLSPVQADALKMMNSLSRITRQGQKDTSQSIDLQKRREEDKRKTLINEWVADAIREATLANITPTKKRSNCPTKKTLFPPPPPKPRDTTTYSFRKSTLFPSKLRRLSTCSTATTTTTEMESDTSTFFNQSANKVNKRGQSKHAMPQTPSSPGVRYPSSRSVCSSFTTNTALTDASTLCAIDDEINETTCVSFHDID